MSTPASGIDHDALILDMRAAAVILERCSSAYGYDPQGGSWSARSLRYEANYLERHRTDLPEGPQ